MGYAVGQQVKALTGVYENSAGPIYGDLLARPGDTLLIHVKNAYVYGVSNNKSPDRKFFIYEGEFAEIPSAK